MNLDNYKEHWKKNSPKTEDGLDKEKMMAIIHKKTKSNVRSNTIGLLGISLGSIAMIGTISNYQKSIADPLVDLVCQLVIPAMVLLAIVSAVLYYITNIKNAKQKNTYEYLQQLITNLKILNKLFYYIILPLMPVMAMPLLLLIISQGHVTHKSIVTIFTVVAIFWACWWVVGFFGWYKKILKAHDYYRLQKETEIELAQL